MNADTLHRMLAPLLDEPVLGRLLFASVEMALLAVGLWAVIRLARLRSARLVSVLWLVVLVKPLVALAVGPLLPILEFDAAPPEPVQIQPIHYPAPEHVAVAPPLEAGQFAPPPRLPAPAPSSRPAISWRWSAPRTMLMAWLLGAVLFGAYALLDRVRLWGTVRRAGRPSDALAGRYDQIADGLGLKRRPRLLVSPAFESPALAGAFAPAILIPAWLVEQPGTTQLDWALRHELMHWKLGDPIANAARQLTQAVFFFHPVTWWAGSKWQEAAELACDRALVRTGGEVEDYADSLYQTLVQIHGRRQRTLMGGLFATRTQIGRRMATLLRNPLESSARLGLVGGLFLALVAVLGLSAGITVATAPVETGSDALPADVGKSGRVLHFPEDRSLGAVFVGKRPLNGSYRLSRGGYDLGSPDYFGEARGTVVLPHDEFVVLKLSPSALHDLSPLASLPPDGLDGLEAKALDYTSPVQKVVYTKRFNEDVMPYVGMLTGLRGLTLSAEDLTDSGLRHIANLKELRELNIRAWNATGDAMAPLRGLRKLEVLCVQAPVTDDGLAALSETTSLRELALYADHMTGRGFEHLAGLPNLEFLMLHDCGFGNSGLRHLAHLKNLKSLGLSHGELRITNAGLRYIGKLTTLEELSFIWVDKNITDSSLAYLKPLQSLRKLNLHVAKITDRGLHHLTALPALEEFSGGTLDGITDAGLETLSQIKTLRVLRPKGHSGGPITDKGLEYLATLPWLEDLTVCGGDGITDQGLAHIGKMTHLRNLILLSDSPHISDAGLAELAQLEQLRNLHLSLQYSEVSISALNKLAGLSRLVDLNATVRRDGATLDISGMTSLEQLTLTGQRPFRDSELACLGGLKNLRRLQVIRGIGDAGMAHVARLKHLQMLYIVESNVTDEGLRYLNDLTDLNSLTVEGQFTAAGLEHLKGLTAIEHLNLQSPNLNQEDLAGLWDRFPNLILLNEAPWVAGATAAPSRSVLLPGITGGTVGPVPELDTAE